MNNILDAVIIGMVINIMIILASYLISRAVTKGFFKELDIYLGKKFVEYVNTKKRKENDTKEEK